eukprot:SAG11_NODE_1381_length_5078_cov_8.176341_1_plen_246_part_00
MRNGWTELALDTDAPFDPHCDYMCIVVMEGPRDPRDYSETSGTHRHPRELPISEEDMGVLRRWGRDEAIMTTMALSRGSARQVTRLLSNGFNQNEPDVPGNWAPLDAAQSFAMRQQCLAQMAERAALQPRVGGGERPPANELTVQLRPTSVQADAIRFRFTDWHPSYHVKEVPGGVYPQPNVPNTGKNTWLHHMADNVSRFTSEELCLTSNRKSWISTDFSRVDYAPMHPLIMVSKLLCRLLSVG